MVCVYCRVEDLYVHTSWEKSDPVVVGQVMGLCLATYLREARGAAMPTFPFQQVIFAVSVIQRSIVFLLRVGNLQYFICLF